MAIYKDHQDAYGHAVYDYLKGRGGYEIVERDDGYINMSEGPAVYHSQYQKWPPYYRKALRHASGRVLDIGCGAGRIALYLQIKGCQVTGVDNSPLAIKTCREQGLRKTRLMSITDINPSIGTFDTIVMLGNNFGLFGSFNRARRLLRRFYRITGTKARIIAESNDPTRTTEPLHLEYHRRNHKKGRMTGQLRLRVRYKIYKTPYFDYLIVSEKEMAQILKGTGWHIAGVFPSGRGPYIAIIEKDPKAL
nr:methyltransferase domain-containing protein [candidate division Zixibacteria bacterium]